MELQGLQRLEGLGWSEAAVQQGNVRSRRGQKVAVEIGHGGHARPMLASGTDDSARGSSG